MIWHLPIWRSLPFRAPQKHFTNHPDRVGILSRAELSCCFRWKRAFAGRRKDQRFYEVIEDTINPEFEYRYFGIHDEKGVIRSIQPFFMLDQDLLLGVSQRLGALITAIRRVWPRFMVLRTLMVGCAAGEGQLDDVDDPSHRCNIDALAREIVGHARKRGADLIVLKEFPAQYRNALSCFLLQGFTRIPGLPMTLLNIEYKNFDDYMTKALKSATRAKFRKKFRATEQAASITLEITSNVSASVDELYPLYLQVYNRSKLHFEKLTKAFFCEVGRRMPDKVRFFIWRQNGKIVAFTLCMTDADAIFAEYIGLDYSVALDLHLYHYAVRDMINWAIANDLKWFRSSALNYDPKLHMRHLLDPTDLYVRHRSAALNAILKRALPLLEPTRHDKILQQFPNYHELWAAPGIAPTPRGAPPAHA
jgi:Peptidogalycan biosysnthesis/recognition